MKWFRSNIRLGSRLALFALAIQFLLSFGHFHGAGAQAASAAVDLQRSKLDAGKGFAALQAHVLDRGWRAKASGTLRLKTSSGHAPAGQPADDCAICAVMALANTMLVATPPCLPAPQAFAWLYATAAAAFADPGSARRAFQPRAPPIA